MKLSLQDNRHDEMLKCMRRRLMAKFTENYKMVRGTRQSWAVKGAKGRRSVLNVTQPRRKAKLQLVQSTAPSFAPYRRPFRHALLSATWYRDDASELRVRGGWCAGDEERESFVRMWLESEFPSPFSSAKFNCTCFCFCEKRESIIERCAPILNEASYILPLSVRVS